MGYLTIWFCLVGIIQWSSPCDYRVCYFTDWSHYREKPATFWPEYIELNLCTHIMYSFAALKNGEITSFQYHDLDSPLYYGLYSRVTNIRRKNTHLKVLLTFGGWPVSSAAFSEMFSTRPKRQAFAKSVHKFLRRHDFDGLDLNYLAPKKSAWEIYHEEGYLQLLHELLSEFQSQFFSGKMSRLLLTVSLPVGLYPISELHLYRIHPLVDFAVIMSHSFHGGFDSSADHSSPLYHFSDPYNNFLTVNYTVYYYQFLQFPKNKLVVGLAMYGRTSRLANSSQVHIGAKILGHGPAGRYTNKEGVLAYYEYCQLVRTAALIGRKGGNPYAVYGSSTKYFLSYEDTESIKEKVKLICHNGLKGIMFWTLDYDDFSGKFCGQGTFPLIKAATEQCFSYTNGSMSKLPLPVVPLQKPNPSQPKYIPKPLNQISALRKFKYVPLDPLCFSLDGVRENPYNCSRYIYCVGGFAYDVPCGLWKSFNKVSKTCQPASELPC